MNNQRKDSMFSQGLNGEGTKILILILYLQNCFMPGMPMVPRRSFFLYAMLMMMMTSFAELLVLHKYTHIIQYSVFCGLYQEERIWSQVKKWKRRKLSNIVLEIIVQIFPE